MRVRKLRVQLQSHYIPSSRRLKKFEVTGPEGQIRAKHLRRIRDIVVRSFPELKLQDEVRENALLLLIAPDEAVLTKKLLTEIQAKIEEAIKSLQL